jgi:FkbM family methyltransferase
VKCFFDVGYRHGAALPWFQSAYGIDETWSIYCFEPNPANHDRFQSASHFVNFRVAAWTHDGFVEIAQHDAGDGQGDGEASSIIDDWRHPGMTRRLRVPCIDFAEWLVRLTSPMDYVVVKLDIEGAEYAVCRRLLTTFAITRIDVLHVEFHHRFMTSENEQSTSALRLELQRFTEVIDHW